VRWALRFEAGDDLPLVQKAVRLRDLVCPKKMPNSHDSGAAESPRS
jgi:hypothetical protein